MSGVSFLVWGNNLNNLNDLTISQRLRKIHPSRTVSVLK